MLRKIEDAMTGKTPDGIWKPMPKFDPLEVSDE